MTLQLIRQPETDGAILGRLDVNGIFECFTLENAALCIPPGRYVVRMRTSAHFQRRVPGIYGVPGRSDIEIHVGNVATDSKGCVLVGQSKAHDSVVHSRIALNALCARLDVAEARHEAMQLTVVNGLEQGVNA